MTKHDYRDALAMCPFYRAQEKLNIVCEGMTTFGSVRIHFRRVKEKERWVRDKCNSIEGCEKCPIWLGKCAAAEEKTRV